VNVACTLGVADLARQGECWRRLRNRAQRARVETADGIRVEFRADDGVEDALRALVAVENECCTWARWEVRREGDCVAMVATSAGEGVATLHTMFV
jgi:hypothetical protein